MKLYLDDSTQLEYAKELADRFFLTLDYSSINIEENELCLLLTNDGLSLKQGSLTMLGDFSSMLPRIKEHNLHSETIVKAAKYKGDKDLPFAIDATAGMGEDSLLLSAMGYQVVMFESNPVIAALLYDSLKRGLNVPSLSNIISRMQLIFGDSITHLTDFTDNTFSNVSTVSTVLPDSIDLILLDPMFPARNKSGLIKKKFQLLQLLEMPCTNENELLDAALSAHSKKIIIKRPAKGPFLSNKKPDYSIKGKSIRYDCLVFPNN